MLRSILVLIDTQGWQKSGSETDDDDESLGEIKWAIEYVASVFREPLEAKDVNIAAFQYEIDEVVGYSRRYLPIQRESYRKIWYKSTIHMMQTSGPPSCCSVNSCLVFPSQVVV